MGCDGGTIPTRDELVRTKKKPEQKDKIADLVAKWKHCALSQDPLIPPIMSCQLGRLYNKESALEFLLDRTKFDCAASFDHLKSLKDLRQLNLTTNRGYSGGRAEKGGCYIDTQASIYICPVAGLEMNGKYRFCFPWSCGCVISERALKEVPSKVCHKCGVSVSEDDIIILNPSEQELEKMKNQMEARRLRNRREKKSRKAEKHKLDSGAAEDGPTTSKQEKLTESLVTENKTCNGTSGKLVTEYRSKLASGKSEDKLSSVKTEDRTNKVNGIQQDPAASSVYKSLFTSSEKAKNQQKAHWVTFNPMYY